MASETLRLPDGTAVHVRYTPARGKRCQEEGCRKDGAKQCDNPVIRGGKAGTCDRHICEGHATPIAKDRDLCPAHAEASKQASAVKHRLPEPNPPQNLDGRTYARSLYENADSDAERYPVVLWRNGGYFSRHQRITGALAELEVHLSSHPGHGNDAWVIQAGRVCFRVDILRRDA